MDSDPKRIDHPEAAAPAEHLAVVSAFIDSQLQQINPYPESDDEDGDINEIRESPNVRLENGTELSCKSHTTLQGDEVSHSRLSISYPSGLDVWIYINADDTLDLTVQQGSEEIHDYADVPREEALQNPDFIEHLDLAHRIIA